MPFDPFNPPKRVTVPLNDLIDFLRQQVAASAETASTETGFSSDASAASSSPAADIGASAAAAAAATPTSNPQGFFGDTHPETRKRKAAAEATTSADSKAQNDATNQTKKSRKDTRSTKPLSARALTQRARKNPKDPEQTFKDRAAELKELRRQHEIKTRATLRAAFTSLKKDALQDESMSNNEALGAAINEINKYKQLTTELESEQSKRDTLLATIKRKREKIEQKELLGKQLDLSMQELNAGEGDYFSALDALEEELDAQRNKSSSSTKKAAAKSNSAGPRRPGLRPRR